MTLPAGTVRLISWTADRSATLEADLEAAGYGVDSRPFSPRSLKQLAAVPVAAVVIDLARRPSQGRDVGVAVRTRAGTRSIPLVFVDGAHEKVLRVREVLPDATFALRSDLAGALKATIASPPPDPVVPESNLAGYAGTPLPKKLGVPKGSVVATIDAPGDFETTLGTLPDGVRRVEGMHPDASVTLWFVDDLRTFRERLQEIAAAADSGRLWICWPKRASGRGSDLTQTEVRAGGLAIGLVDFKICAIDATWSGLCFTRRKP